MNERGVYQNIKRGKQLLRFDGIKYGKITHTDLDAVIEYHDKIWVLHEVKTKGKDVPYGQKLALERWIKDCCKIGKPAIAIISEHEIYNTDNDIYLKDDCYVREFLCTEMVQKGNSWRPPTRKIKAVDMESIYISLNDK